MRVGVRRLNGTLLCGQLGTSGKIIVIVPGALWKDRREQIDVRTNGLWTRAQTRGEALRKIPGGRVERAIKAAVVPIEHVAVGGGRLSPNINNVETATRRDVEAQFEWWHRGN